MIRLYYDTSAQRTIAVKGSHRLKIRDTSPRCYPVVAEYLKCLSAHLDKVVVSPLDHFAPQGLNLPAHGQCDPWDAVGRVGYTLERLQRLQRDPKMCLSWWEGDSDACKSYFHLLQGSLLRFDPEEKHRAQCIGGPYAGDVHGIRIADHRHVLDCNHDIPACVYEGRSVDGNTPEKIYFVREINSR